MVKEEIMSDINALVQEFRIWRTSNVGACGESIFEMRCLFEIFGGVFCSEFILVPFKFATAVRLS